MLRYPYPSRDRETRRVHKALYLPSAGVFVVEWADTGTRESLTAHRLMSLIGGPAWVRLERQVSENPGTWVSPRED
jgi:hypothetical protein